MSKKAVAAGSVTAIIISGVISIFLPTTSPNLDNIEKFFGMIREFFPIIASAGLACWVWQLHLEHKACRESLAKVNERVTSIYRRLAKIEKDNAS